MLIVIKTMNKIRGIILLSFFSMFAGQQLFSQSVGDYYSIASGNWGTLSTWQVWGTPTPAVWNAASSPPGSTNNVVVTTGTIVIVEASSKFCKDLTVQTGAQLY